MKTVELIEIENLYTACKVKEMENYPIRTSLNMGTLNNKLNCDYSFMNRNSVSANYNSNVLTNKNN